MPLKPSIKFFIFSIGLSAPNNEPMPSLILLINEPPLNELMPSPNDFNAGPANAKFFISVKLNIIVASAIFSIAGPANAPISMNGSIGANNAIAAPTANTPPAADASPFPLTSARLLIPVINSFSGPVTSDIPTPNTPSATPNAAIAKDPAIINGDAKLSIAAAPPSVRSPAANTPIVLNPTSFIKLRPNANGITAAPNNTIAAAPCIIPIEPLPNTCANAAKPPNANVPLTIDAKSTSLNCLSPTPAIPTEAPNNAIAAAPLRTLLSPNFLTASAIVCKKPPPLPIGIVALSALSDAPFNMPDTLPPMPLTLSLNPFGTSAFAFAPKLDTRPPAFATPLPTTSGAPPFVSLPIKDEAALATVFAILSPPLNIFLPNADA